MKMANLVLDDISNPPLVLRGIDSLNKVRIREQYTDLLCSSCGKLDEMRALERGIDPVIKLRSKRDMYDSWDSKLIISERVRRLMERAGCDVMFAEFPASKNWYVLWPRIWIPIDRESDAFRLFGDPCSACGRYSNVLGGPGIPKIQFDVPFAAIPMEDRSGFLPDYVVSIDLAEQLKSAEPPIKGLHLKVKNYE